ncbi:hypothetical protein [Bradyrhizobium sp. 33ap4]|uniref:hypothetical protein n=1 Tax=Bradyrhizobium sp. 33ap4 TaxID=3061630 RepID=UPI00292DCAFF|nr:hypothetical protein [Bradyrhizobium sp. 33ap4]
MDTAVKALPDGLNFSRDVPVGERGSHYLPDNLRGAAASCRFAHHENLTVSGRLYLRDAAIATLPGNLKLGGDLWITDTSITAITASAQIGGRVCGLKPGLADAKDASRRPSSFGLAPSVNSFIDAASGLGLGCSESGLLLWLENRAASSARPGLRSGLAGAALPKAFLGEAFGLSVF